MEKESKARYGTGSIWQRGSVWWIQYRKNGVRYREATNALDRKKAEDILRDKLPRSKRVANPEAVTYEDIRRNYLERAIEKGLRSLKKVGDEERSLDTMTRLDEFFAGWRVATISLSDLRRFRQEGLDDGLSDVRMNRYMALLRAMFRVAAKEEMITQAEMPAYFPMVKERNEGRGAIYVKPEWYEALKKELKEPLRSAFILAYHCGIRVGGELRKLRWRDFDFAKNKIRLPGSITKTGNQRVIFIPKDFDRKAGKPDAIVFPLDDIRPEWRAACVTIGAGWYECRKCGARCADQICPEDGRRQIKGMRYSGLLLRHTRHTAARNLIDAGLDRDRAKAITGHLTDSTFSRYNIGVDSDVDDTRKTMEAFHRRRK